MAYESVVLSVRFEPFSRKMLKDNIIPSILLAECTYSSRALFQFAPTLSLWCQDTPSGPTRSSQPMIS